MNVYIINALLGKVIFVIYFLRLITAFDFLKIIFDKTYMSWIFFFHDIIMVWCIMASIDVISNLKRDKKTLYFTISIFFSHKTLKNTWKNLSLREFFTTYTNV